MSRPLIAWASAVLFTALACQPAAALEAIAGTQLVMHVGPSADHASIATIPAETRLTVHGCSEAEGWCLVRFAGRHGWIEGESLNVVGFSRPPQPAVAPGPQQVVLVPVPVAPEAPLPPFITADDVIVGMGEQFGLAAIAPGLGAKPFDLKNRRHAGLAFKHGDFKGGTHFRHHGHFAHPHLDRHGFHAGEAIHFGHPRFGKEFHVSRGHFGQRGRFARHGKSLDRGWHFARGSSSHHVSRGHFGQRRHFVPHGKSLDRGWHFARGHSRHHFGKGGFGHSGKASFGGLRVKGGWRP